jgi:hypothetical protein
MKVERTKVSVVRSLLLALVAALALSAALAALLVATPVPRPPPSLARPARLDQPVRFRTTPSAPPEPLWPAR